MSGCPETSETHTDGGLSALLNPHKLVLDIRLVAIRHKGTSSLVHPFSILILPVAHVMLRGSDNVELENQASEEQHLIFRCPS